MAIGAELKRRGRQRWCPHFLSDAREDVAEHGGTYFMAALRPREHRTSTFV